MSPDTELRVLVFEQINIDWINYYFANQIVQKVSNKKTSASLRRFFK